MSDEAHAVERSGTTDGLVRISGLRKSYVVRNGWGRKTGRVDAVDGIDLSLREGETLAVVGESGSGKSTLGRLILGIERPDAGVVEAASELRMQVIHQDPFSSLNPHRTALQNVLEPLTVRGARRGGDAAATARQALASVGIEGDDVHKRPRSFSGGQRQRIAIARAIAPQARLIVCDEPVSALDVSIQAQVTDLLRDLQRRLGLTYLFISHDLAVVRDIATRTAVMRRGRIVELADTATLFGDPRHPYTHRLLEAVLSPDPVSARERLAHVSTRPAPLPADPAERLVEIAPGHFVASAGRVARA